MSHPSSIGAPAARPQPSSPGAPPPAARHWVVPFAAGLSDVGQHALQRLDEATALPHLRALLGSMAPVQQLGEDEYALSMPHERVLAATMGWPAEDGRLPWAAWQAARDGLTLDPARAWGLLSPTHWLVGHDHLTLIDPDSLALGEAESRALFDAARPLFEEDGWAFAWGTPTRWYAAHDTLRELPTASLDRVIGRNPDLWLNDHPQARWLRRLQAEVQMLFYQHPVNDAREAAGQLPINSFWLSGCGTPPATLRLPAEVIWVDALRAPLLAEDGPAWLAAWQALDAEVMAEVHRAVAAGEPVRLTLAGERQAITLQAMPRAQGLGGLVSRVWQAVRGTRATTPAALLRTL